MISSNIFRALTLVSLLFLPTFLAISPAQAEEDPAQPSEASEHWTIHVQVSHEFNEEADLANLPVILHVVRPRGPFETQAPRPLATFTATTDSQGLATFTSVPNNIAQQGLRLQASTSFNGLSFDSTPYNGTDQLKLTLPVFDRGEDLSGLRVAQKRIVVEPWEQYMIISQFWTFVLDSEHAVDLNLVSDPALARGLPIRLPIPAEGIHFSGPGQAEIINNFVFWNGVLRPGEPITLQIRFSYSARSSTWTYEQTMDYPVDDIQIIAPLHTQYQKIPRLNNLTLLAPGFNVDADPATLGLRTDTEFLLALGRSVEAGESYAFRLEGLPFKRPIGGWIALFGGFLAMLFLAAYGHREYKFLHNSRGRKQILTALRRQRDALLDELAELHRDAAEAVDDEELLFEIEEEQTLIRERLGLILRKIAEVEAESAAL